MTTTERAGLEARLQELLDKQAIREVVLRYCRGVDRLDLDAVRECYHPGGVDHHTGFTGPVEEYVEWLRGLLPRLDTTMHVVANQLIELDGDLARSESYGTAYHFGEPQDDITRNFITGFRYVDTFERRGGEWRIAERHALREYTIAVPASARIASPDSPTGSRDRNDPVYAPLRRPDAG